MTDLQESVILHEAIMDVPYLDSMGLWTMAVGRCVERNPLTGAEWKQLLDAKMLSLKISNQGSMLLLDHDLDACRAQCERVFAFWPTLDEARREVLIEMAFQIGIDGVRKFTHMIGSIASHDYKAAAVFGLDSLWAKQTPARAHELMARMEKGS